MYESVSQSHPSRLEVVSHPAQQRRLVNGDELDPSLPLQEEVLAWIAQVWEERGLEDSADLDPMDQADLIRWKSLAADDLALVVNSPPLLLLRATDLEDSAVGPLEEAHLSPWSHLEVKSLQTGEPESPPRQPRHNRGDLVSLQVVRVRKAKQAVLLELPLSVEVLPLKLMKSTPLKSEWALAPSSPLPLQTHRGDHATMSSASPVDLALPPRELFHHHLPVQERQQATGAARAHQHLLLAPRQRALLRQQSARSWT